MFGLKLQIGLAAAATATIALAASEPSATAFAAPAAAPAANIAITPHEQPLVEGIATHRSFRRASDGLFYVHARANGQTVRFIIDTGATVVVLNRQDADRLGLAFEKLSRGARMNTVGGPSAMKWAEIERLEMAGKKLEGVTVAVVEQGPPVSLLGQNALAMLGTVTLRGDELTID